MGQKKAQINLAGKTLTNSTFLAHSTQGRPLSATPKATPLPCIVVWPQICGPSFCRHLKLASDWMPSPRTTSPSAPSCCRTSASSDRGSLPCAPRSCSARSRPGPGHHHRHGRHTAPIPSGTASNMGVAQQMARGAPVVLFGVLQAATQGEQFLVGQSRLSDRRLGPKAGNE